MKSELQAVRPSATLAMNERIKSLDRQGRNLYRLGFGQSPFPVPGKVVMALEENASRKDYLPVRGLPALREAVADWHRRVVGLNAEAEDILIGPGSKELIFLAQMVIDGELLLPSPSWVSYGPQARLLGLDVVTLPTFREDGWRPMPEELEKACGSVSRRTRVLVLNYPNNPTGLTLDAGRLEALAAVARRHGVLIIADEIYGELHHTGGHQSMARYYPEGTIVTGGLSKWCGAGGWRLGTALVPRQMRPVLDGMALVAGETFSTVSAPIQYAAVTAYGRDEEIGNYVAQSRRIIRALGRAVSGRLRITGIDTPEPEGAFYLFPDFTAYKELIQSRGLAGCRAFCERLLEDTGVALLPGSDFGRPEDEFTCRLAYVDFDGEAALDAARAIPLDRELDQSFLEAHCGRVLEAIDLIGKWANGLMMPFAPDITISRPI